MVSPHSDLILKKRTLCFWIFWGVGLHFLFVLKTFVDVIQILPKTPNVDTDAVMVPDALRKPRHLIGTVNDATLNECIAQAGVLIQRVHETGLSL